ncbi:hypothetical protein ACWKSP_30855 [Micromonosporaceae bacterium Da 78-11]
MLLRQRFGRVIRLPAGVEASVQPVQIGSDFRHRDFDGSVDERGDDVLILEFRLASKIYSTSPYSSSAAMQSLLEKLRRFCPNLLTVDTEERRRTSYSVHESADSACD